jgi:hypothetical protein
MVKLFFKNITFLPNYSLDKILGELDRLTKICYGKLISLKLERKYLEKANLMG